MVLQRHYNLNLIAPSWPLAAWKDLFKGRACVDDAVVQTSSLLREVALVYVWSPIESFLSMLYRGRAESPTLAQH